MEENLKKLREEFFRNIERVSAGEELDALEIEYFGRKAGKLTQVLRGLKDLPENIRPKIGNLANQVKQEMENVFLKKREILESKRSELSSFDLTLPGTPPNFGHLHIVSHAIEEVTRIFERIGFYRVLTSEAEWDYYAFEALNMPKDHPARDEWETFFIAGAPGKAYEGPQKMGKMVLIPHTSSVQVREMEKGKLPIRSICISKCYRRQIDVSHVPMFHQFEGLYIDSHVTLSHLFGVLEYFFREFFGTERKMRIRPFHFQFTEPSFEIDISCGVCGGSGCRLCKQGWLELGGAGMVHPNVLKAGKIDPKKYSGFAFGWGVERTYMMKEGLRLPDIRILYQNDLRFLEQF